MKTYLKTLERMFQKHITRLISLIFIVLVSVGFVSGVGGATDKIEFSLADYYVSQNVSDFIVKSTQGEFSEEQLSAVKQRYGEENVFSGVSIDVDIPVDGETRLVRLYFLEDFPTQKVNICQTQSQTAAEGNVVWAEEADNKIKSLELGCKFELDFADILTRLAEDSLDEQFSYLLQSLQPTEVTVSKIVRSPLTFANDGEPSYRNPEDTPVPDDINGVNSLITLDHIFYLSYDLVPKYEQIAPEQLKPFLSEEELKKPLLAKGDLYITFANRALFSAFSREYKDFLHSERAALGELLGDSARMITLEDNYSFLSLKSYSDKVMGIGYVLMAAFLFVTALVALSTMTRLLEEERAQIACLKTLGYSSAKIIFKYLLFAMIGTGLGGVGAYFVGIVIARLLYFVFNYSFAMPPMALRGTLLFFLLTYFVIVIATLSATVLAGRKLVSEKPADLLRPKVPKAGRKVILERIPIIWNLLSFKYKSTMRNVLRYRYRFLMTVISVAISTALVLAGLALLDTCLFGELQSASIMAIAVVVVIFAGLLTAVVIYTLTNINVSERNRELATLKVLGYHDVEVAGYIYREVYIDSAIGIVLGYPLSLALMKLLFKIMGIGSIGGVSWFMWLIAPAVVFLFTFVITLILKNKIVKIDMNESLKAIE